MKKWEVKWQKGGKRLEELKKLAARGLSCSVIARTMGEGLTKNAIVGACYRNGVELRAHPARVRMRERMRELQLAVASGVVVRSDDMKKSKKAAVVPAKIKVSKKPGKVGALGRAYVLTPSVNAGNAPCMWNGCTNNSMARGKPYCSYHLAKYRASDVSFTKAG